MPDKIIKHEDIRAGDTIRVEWVYGDGAYTHTVTVDHKYGDGGWMTKGNFGTSTMSKGSTIYLVNRPMKPLPTEPGTVILVTETLGRDCRPFYAALHRDGHWLALPSAHNLHPSHISDWKEAKLVTVEDGTE